jgi:hypothetical protein
MRTVDVWKKLHKGEPTVYTWQQGDAMTQEKRLDGFYTNNKDAHGGGEIDSDHKIVETVREWNPVDVPRGNKADRRKIPTILTMDEHKMFNEDIHNDLRHEEFILEGEPSEIDINRSAHTISEALVAATDRITQRRATNDKEKPNQNNIKANKNWGLE